MILFKILTTALVVMLVTSCGKPEKDLTSYDSAKAWVQAEYSAEVMEPDSSLIHRVEFYASSPNKWLVVYFKNKKSKGFLYQGITAGMWSDWKSSQSKGSWYHKNIKGHTQYIFTPQSNGAN